MREWWCRCFASSVLIIAAALLAPAAFAQTTYSFNLPEQPLADSLRAIGQQTEMNILFEPDAVKSVRSPALRGSYTADDAIRWVLKGTKLEAQHTTATNVVVKLKSATSTASPAADVNSVTGPGTRVAQSASGEQQTVLASDESTDIDQKSKKEEGLTEIVVTGTNIRGVSPASPMVILDDTDFKRGGYATVAEVMQSLPQNFSGGLDPGTSAFSPTAQAAGNVGLVTTANLYGLGSNATLVLLDGHRLAGSGESGAIDISAIPLSALERIEVLTDGASAMYGSDAVAGVVNFVLKRNFSGVEATAQYGGATEGGSQENREGTTYGGDWGSGNVLASYERYGQAALSSTERSFSNDVSQPNDLLPELRRDSGLLTMTQDITDTTNLYLNTLYSRTQNSIAQTQGISTFTTNALSVTPGVAIGLADDWRADISALYGLNDDNEVLVVPGQPGSTAADWRYTLAEGDAKADGPLFATPGGTSKLAVGFGWRRESFGVPAESVQPESRSVEDVFAELNVPLLRMGDRELLTLNGAGRYEHYSDFGSTTNPKLGLTASPLRSVKLRGTWGTSFRAPDLYEEFNPGYAYVFNEPYPASPTGSALTLARLGGNPALGPEKSRTFTLGADYQSIAIPNLRASVTYFDTNYRSRIGEVNGNPFTFLANPSLYPPPLLIFDPSASFINSVINGVGANNVHSLVGPFNPADIAVYQDDRPVNSAVYNENGMDMDVKYTAKAGFGSLGSQFSATYLFKIDQQITSTGPVVDIANTLFYPVKLRLRASEDWTRGSWSSSVAFNFQGKYQNNTVTPTQSIASFATFDLRGSYALNAGLPSSSPWSGFSISVAVRNLLDRQPPYVESSTFLGGVPLHYDPSNASPIGRFVTVQLGKRW